MKVLLLVFPIILCADVGSVTACVNIRYWNSAKLLGIPLMNTIESKCRTDENPKQFEHSFQELNYCINDVMREQESSESFDLSDYNQDHCSYFNKSQIRVCFENLTRNISSCLAENKIFIQEFLLNAFDILYEELCGANRVSNKEYIYDKVNRTGNCIQTCAQLLGSCNPANLNIVKQLDKGILNLNKNGVCSDLKSLHKCSTQVLEGVCNEEYSRLMDLIFHPFLKDCNNLEEKN